MQYLLSGFRKAVAQFEIRWLECFAVWRKLSP
jgi:hypothetical protein